MEEEAAASAVKEEEEEEEEAPLIAEADSPSSVPRTRQEAQDTACAAAGGTGARIGDREAGEGEAGEGRQDWGYQDPAVSLL